MVERHGRRLYAFLRSMLLSHDDADDVLQETLLKAWKHLPSFRGESSEATWLFRIAINEAIGFQRRKKLRQLALLRWADQKRQQTAGPTRDPDLLLNEALKLLSARQRAVFVLHYSEQLPFDQIAKVMNMKEGTAKATYHQATEKIKNYLTNHAEF